MQKGLAPAWIKELAVLFVQNKQEFFVVGGALRNQLLNLPVAEWDCATSAKPDETEKLMKEFGCRNINTIGKRFGTIIATFENEQIEITTFRSDEYEFVSRKPTVHYGKSIKEDLTRRDFTINAIAYDPCTNEVIDPEHGQEDLANRLIRSVGNPNDRFAEDPLRMLRAIRFMVQLDFFIEHQTLIAIRAEKERFKILSAERIAQELNKILLSPRPSLGIQAIVETGLIEYILPELLPSINLEFDPRQHKDIYHHILQVLDQTPPDLALRWTALLHDIAKPLTRKKIGGEYHFLGHEVVGAKMAVAVLKRLKYPNDFIHRVKELVYHHQRIPNYEPGWTDGGVRRFVRDTGDILEDLFTFAQADSTGGNAKKLEQYRQLRTQLKERIAQLEKEAEIAKIRPPLDGDDLITMFNRPAGPWIKPIKEKLLSMVLDGELDPNDKEKAAEIARQLMRGSI